MSTGSSVARKVITIIWRIQNVRYLYKKVNRFAVQSPDFWFVNALSKRFYLYLALEDVYKEEECLSIYPMGSLFDIPIDCELSLIDSKGSPLVSWTVKYHLFGESEPLSIPKLKTEEVFGTRKCDYLLNDALTVQCRMWKCFGSFMDDEFISGISLAEEVENSFFWTLDDFSKLNLNRAESKSVILDFSNYTIVLDLNCVLLGESLEEAEARFVLIAYGYFISVEISIKLSFIDSEQELRKCTDAENQILRNKLEGGWIVIKIASRKELLSEQSDCLRHDALTLFCELKAVSGFSSTSEKRYHGIVNVTELIKSFLMSHAEL